MIFHKMFVELENGETYAYLQKGMGEKTLILIHGNLSSSLYFKPLMQRLPESIRVVAPDLRGFGDSTYNESATAMKTYAEDLKCFMDALSIEKAVILGWSLGGGVAMEFAAAYPEKTEKLILLNSTTHKGYPIFKKAANGQPIFTEGYASSEEMAEDPIQVKPMIQAIIDQNIAFIKYIYELTIYVKNKPLDKEFDLYVEETLKQRNLADVDFALASLNMSKVPNLYAMGDGTIQNIQAPVVHIWGTLDITVPEYMVLENIAALQDQSKYIKYEECGHSPLVDKPDELTKDLLNFLK